MLAFRLLIRNWRSGELKLLSVSIILAVAVLSGISIFTDRLESTLLSQSNTLLGADNIVNSSKTFNKRWLDDAAREQLSQAQVVEFNSMAYVGEEMHLVSVKAVSKNYPLRGHLEVSQIPFALQASDISIATGIPLAGEVWIDSRLLPMLNAKLGDQLAVGELQLKITQLLIREPEPASPFNAMAPRVLMNMDDVAATQVAQVGSKIKYSWLLASDEPRKLENFLTQLKPKLSQHERIEDIASSQERLGNTLHSGKNFLLLAAVIAVLLSGVAISIAARQFSDRHTNQVALMKSLGASAGRIRRLYFSQLLILGAVASAIGLAIGYGIQALIAVSLQSNFQLVLHAAHGQTYVLSFLSGLICLIFFALPALWFLPSIPPLKILRRELAVNSAQLWLQACAAFAAIIFLVGLFSRDLLLTVSVAGALLVIVLASSVVSAGLLMLSKKLLPRLGGFWRLAFANLQRRKGQSLVQVMVFSVAIMLLLTLTIVRTSLIDDWQRQLPVDSANHFLVNIPPAALYDVKAMLQVQQIAAAPLYPMILGRLVSINNSAPSEELIKKTNALRREINLTQADLLPEDNKLVAGEWWDTRKKTKLPGVSVENDTAKSLGVNVGDKLQFSLGGLVLDAQVASIRTVDWKSMRPNFFFIFEPQSMDGYSPSFMTSIYLPPNNKTFVSQLLSNYPTIVVVEFERILEQMRNIIKQVSDGIQWVLVLTLFAGALVLFAAVMSSMDNRKQEAGLLRALGCSRKLIVGSVLVEFMVVGFVAGFIAIISAEILLVSLQKFAFEPHYIYWLLAPLGSAVFISALGVFSCRSVVTTPPAVVLRDAG